MNYREFVEKLESKIFGEDLVCEILENVIQNPSRYIGIFRITNAKTKLIQNITQSCEIKFGGFIENILTEYIEHMGYTILDNLIGLDEVTQYSLYADQIFKRDNTLFLIEQKIRDDHDSTKKRGQWTNFVSKIHVIRTKYPKNKINAIMWFTDDSLSKNKRYYELEMYNASQIADTRTKLYLLYGKELFSTIFERDDVWQEITSYLRQYRQEKCLEILNVPDFDTSEEVYLALRKLKTTNIGLIRKLLSNEPKYCELRNELFPTGKNLQGLNANA